MKLFFKILALAHLTGITLEAQQAATHLIIFSKNRPLQLYAFLESCERYVSGINSLTVIWYTDNQSELSYEVVQQTFPDVKFLNQKKNGLEGDFKSLTKKAVDASDAPYIIFSVDDVVVVDYVDLTRCAELLEHHKGYGFYLRLGTNITDCYMEKRATGHPPLTLEQDGVYSWKFSEGSGDWAYPHSVDMTLFRKKDIIAHVRGMKYHSPNTFEARWAMYTGRAWQSRGLCFTYSKIVNLPINLVQSDYKNRHGSSCDAYYLLKQFLKGLKMDINPLHKLLPSAPHMPYQPTFIPR